MITEYFTIKIHGRNYSWAIHKILGDLAGKDYPSAVISVSDWYKKQSSCPNGTGTSVGPILLIRLYGRYWVIDGNHRMLGYKRQGLKQVTGLVIIDERKYRENIPNASAHI